jgi:hypothetical protein
MSPSGALTIIQPMASEINLRVNKFKAMRCA